MPQRNLYAAVDLGSSSFHLLVARRDHGELRIIDGIREMVRIAGGLDSNGRLDQTTRQRALGCLARFGQRLADIPMDQVRAVGTQTFRRLAHPQSLLVVAETALGCPIDIISGREEARLVWLGVSQGMPFNQQPRLVIDIGGGSTEIVAGRELEPTVAESLQFGCVSATRAAFADGRLSRKRWDRLSDEIATELQALKSAIAQTHWRHAIGSSGTIRAVQKIIAAASNNPPRAIAFDQVVGLRDQLIELRRLDSIDLAGLSASRQPVIAGGVLVLEACMRTFEIEQIEVSPVALREGLLHDLFGRLEHRDPRQKSVLAMARRFEADQTQATRVRDFALCALDQIAQTWSLHTIHRDLLDWSCQLHEIGLGIAHSQYQLHSAYIVENSDLAGFSRQEQHYMALLLRYQRRKLPADALQELPERQRASARPLLAILRLAIALGRARSDADLPDFALQAPDRKRLVFSAPPGWLQSHPLSARSLELEKRQLANIGLKLSIKSLPAALRSEPGEA
ncbi:MAG: exopolyphosphatase [Wenzhouxiangellaceae bacterium]